MKKINNIFLTILVIIVPIILIVAKIKYWQLIIFCIYSFFIGLIYSTLMNRYIERKEKDLKKLNRDQKSKDLFNEAMALVIHEGAGSAGLLQMKLKVGYTISAELMEMLGEAGIIEEADGAKPRKVIKQMFDHV